MKDTLEALWRGDIDPFTDSQRNTPEMKQLMEYIARHHDKLLKTMSEEQKDIFERFNDCRSEYTSLSNEALFVYAFRLGARLMIDILSQTAYPPEQSL